MSLLLSKSMDRKYKFSRDYDIFGYVSNISGNEYVTYYPNSITSLEISSDNYNIAPLYERSRPNYGRDIKWYGFKYTRVKPIRKSSIQYGIPLKEVMQINWF